ncbi:MAG: methyltransferase domain-containing protein [Xanthobacteraceae bacterium]
MAEVKITFDAADDYERFMGAWSRSIGERFLAWLDAPAGGRWLDVGCGTGAFSELILRSAAPASLTGIDPSAEQIAHVRKHLAGHTFEVGDSMAMPFGENAFDVVASALVFHFIPDRAKAFAEMKRVLSAGGLVGGYTWKRSASEDFAPYAPMKQGTADIGAEFLSSPLVPEGSAEGMRASLAAAGFTDIAVTEFTVTRTFADFEEFWAVQSIPFSPPGRTIAKLGEAQRERLRDVMRERMTPAADGSITYAATAMAGKARKP